jgi:hypothetical protein
MKILQLKSSFSSQIGDRCYDFLNIFAEKFSKKLAFLTQNKAKFLKKIYHNIGF